MKKLFPMAFFTLALISCEKNKDDLTPEPQQVIVHKQINASFEYTSPLRVDINNDGKDDFSFGNVLVSDSEGAHNLFYVRALEQNQVLLNTQSEISLGHWGADLQFDDLVQEDQAKNFQWQRGTGYLLDIRKPDQRFTYYDGPLSSNGSNQFIGIKLKEGDKFKTGWIELEYVMGSEKVEIKEAAFLPAESQSLKAGQR